MKIRKPIRIDALLLSAMVFIFIFLVSTFFPIKLKVFHPIKDAFSDFDYTDFYFSKLKQTPEVSSDIIVVNIGHLSRAEIAAQLNVVTSGKPKVIGLDAIFIDRKDELSDSLLHNAIANAKIVVGIQKIDSVLIESHAFLRTPYAGYANLYGEAEPEKVVRYFAMSEFLFKKPTLSFTAEIASIYDTAFNEVLAEDGLKKLKINYRNPSSFITLSTFELFNPAFDPVIFKDKIVMMGYTGDGRTASDLEDQHFTPMNHKIAGKSLPDMKGIYIHTSILQSLLDRSYIRNASLVLEIILTVLFTFLASWLIIYYYVHKARWFHLMSKLVQLFAGVIFLFISIWIMDTYHVKINFTLLFVTLVLCADLVYFYDPFAKWLHKRKWFNSEILKH